MEKAISDSVKRKKPRSRFRATIMMKLAKMSHPMAIKESHMSPSHSRDPLYHRTGTYRERGA